MGSRHGNIRIGSGSSGKLNGSGSSGKRGKIISGNSSGKLISGKLIGGKNSSGKLISGTSRLPCGRISSSISRMNSWCRLSHGRRNLSRRRRASHCRSKKGRGGHPHSQSNHLQHDFQKHLGGHPQRNSILPSPVSLFLRTTSEFLSP